LFVSYNIVFLIHAQKFKWLAKRMLYGKATFCCLNANAKGLTIWIVACVVSLVMSHFHNSKF